MLKFLSEILLCYPQKKFFLKELCSTRFGRSLIVDYLVRFFCFSYFLLKYIHFSMSKSILFHRHIDECLIS